MNLGSPMHWLVIGIVALLLFGNRLPEVARSIGRAMNEFKRGLREVDTDLDQESKKEPDRLKSPPDDAPATERRDRETQSVSRGDDR